MSIVRAAGGVAWRPTRNGVDVCLVHRPRYDDWSLPKGKLEPGEHPLLAAVREVAEEADVRAVPQVRLPRARYTTRDGSAKTVDFWSMRAVDSGGFQIHQEVDGIQWLPVDEAIGLVSYPQDVRVLRAFAALPQVTASLALVRHASAVAPESWTGTDSARPLDATGLEQARSLAPLLGLVDPRRLLSATARRCTQTLDPLAQLLDLRTEADPALDEPGLDRDPDARCRTAAARLAELAEQGAATVCAQGGVIQGALAWLVNGISCTASAESYATPVATGWLLAFAADRLVAVDRLLSADTLADPQPGRPAPQSDCPAPPSTLRRLGQEKG